jgi:adenine-specific DNA methylase
MDSSKLPLEMMDEFAERESYRRDVYRPVYSLHKWWARRPGSTFRILGLAALTDDSVTKDEILRRSGSGSSYQGLYLDPPDQSDFGDKTVLDPFSGGGVTHFELNRLGAHTVGYELNPVAWWIIKKSIETVDLDVLQEAYEEVLEATREELSDIYTTTDPDTGNECEVLYTIWMQTLPCQSCGDEVEMMPRWELQRSRKTRPAVVYCPNPDCEDRLMVLNETDGSGGYRDIQDTETCDSCGTTFDPTFKTASSAKFTCVDLTKDESQREQHKNDTKEVLERTNTKPNFKPIAIQYSGPSGDKKYKEPDEDDLKNIRTAKETAYNSLDSLPIPQQTIPDGMAMTTGSLVNHNYDHFYEIFTGRQLLSFGTLLKHISNVDDDDARELLVTAVSSCLNRNSKLCKWDYDYAYATDVFERKSYIPRTSFGEGNPLNHDENIVSFQKAYERVYNAKSYGAEPFEKVKEDGDVVKYPIQGDGVHEGRLDALYSKTSERMGELDDNSVDYVITDPPYFDNVQYSELSEYFYVWLREGLKDDYDEFEPKHVPKAREIVANSFANKDQDFFIEALSNVFSECERVLKDDGDMVFTYHHNKSEAWSVILSSLIEAGFTVTGAYPVQSEMPNNPAISDLDNTEYDIIVTANTDRTDEEISLQELHDQLYFDVQEWAKEERQRHRHLSAADFGVVLRGRCMYHYSRHYPDVYDGDETVSVEQSLATADDVISQVLESSVDLPPTLDEATRSFASHLQRINEDDAADNETFDELRKHLMPRNLEVDDLEDEKLITGSREAKSPVDPGKRVTHIEQKLRNGGSVLDIDKVHYLKHLFETDQNTTEYLRKWRTTELEELAEFLAETTGNEVYSRVMDMGLTQYGQ